MKILLISLILLFSFNSWTKADDIREIEIEGMSIGDSLLDFFSQRNSGVYFEIDQIKRYVKILENYIRKNNTVSKDKWEKEKLSLQQYISKLTTFI